MNGSNEDSEKRMLRYKEDRRKQLAAQVASRLYSNGSSSDEEPATSDRRSYTEYKRRRRRERGAKSNEKNSSRHNLNSSGGELHHSRSRGSPEPLQQRGGSDQSRLSSEPSRLSSETGKGSPLSSKGSRASSSSRTRGSRGSLDFQAGSKSRSRENVHFDPGHGRSTTTADDRRGQRRSSDGLERGPRRSTESLERGHRRSSDGHDRGPSRSTLDRGQGRSKDREFLAEPWTFEVTPATSRPGSGSSRSRSVEVDRNKESPEHIYQVITERPYPSPRHRNQQQDLSTDSNSNSRDSLADRSGSRDSLGERDGERDGLVSPDVIKTAVNQITPVPRRRKRQSDENYLTAKYPAKPALELNLPSSRPSPDKNNLDLGKANPEERRPSLDLASSRLNLAGQNPESPGSVLSPTSNLSASKPPIFPTPDRSSGAFKYKKSNGDSPPGFMRSDSRSDNEQSSSKDLPGFVRRRSGHLSSGGENGSGVFGQFNPNEPAPPRPHSVYKMESQHKSRTSDPDLHLPLNQKERRKSDFLTHYEELTCRAAMAIKTVDKIVGHGGGGGTLPSPLSSGACLSPLSPGSCLPSPLSPGVESVEFNEEEVLKTCQDFLVDYNKSKLQNNAGLSASLNPSSATPPMASSLNPTTFLQPVQPGQSPQQQGIPVPAPRLSLTGSRRSISQPSRPVSQLSQEDEQLLEAAQNKQFWERGEGADKILRGRSSSFSMPDRRSSSFLDQQTQDQAAVNLRPILKKSVEDLSYPGGANAHQTNSTISILKNRDDIFGKTKRRSAGEEGKNEHVRIRSPSPRTEHVRIRTPSPSSSGSPSPRPGRRSRNNSTGDDRSDLEFPSILKRRVSADDLQLEDYPGFSPEKSSILKRKASFGSTYSGSHSPEGTSEGTRSILKKSSRNSSRTCSRSASIEDLDQDQTKSILKSRNSSRTCSRSGSQEDLDLDLDDDDDEWLEPKPKSILKKKQGSTDDELDDRPERPKSILKSRRSEESLSPSNEQFGFSDTPRSSQRFTRHASLPSDSEDIPSGRNSPLVQFPTDIAAAGPPRSTSAPGSRRRFREEGDTRPLRRDDGSLPGILKYREKSSSPSRARSDKSSSPFRDSGRGSRSDAATVGRRSPHSAFETFSPRSSSSPRVPTPPPWGPASPPPPSLWATASPPPPRRADWRRRNSEENEILCIIKQQDDLGQIEAYDSPMDPSKMSLSERVQMFDSIGQNIGRPPRIGGSTGNGGRRRRKQNPRFLTQPITVDEVEKARKGFMEPGARVSPLGGARTSPLYSMLRPVSLEEIVGEVLVPKPVKGIPINISSHSSDQSAELRNQSSSNNRTIIRFSSAKITSSPSSSPPGAANTTPSGPTATSAFSSCQPSRSSSHVLPTSSVFRPVPRPRSPTQLQQRLRSPPQLQQRLRSPPIERPGTPPNLQSVAAPNLWSTPEQHSRPTLSRSRSPPPQRPPTPPAPQRSPTPPLLRIRSPLLAESPPQSPPPVSQPRPPTPPISLGQTSPRLSAGDATATAKLSPRHSSSPRGTLQAHPARSLASLGSQIKFSKSSPPLSGSSPPPPRLPRQRSLGSRRSPPPQPISPPSSPSGLSSLNNDGSPSTNPLLRLSPPALSDDASPTVPHRPSAFRPVGSSALKSSSPPPQKGENSPGAFSTFSSRGSAFRPVEHSVMAELTPVMGPIPVRDSTQENGVSTEDLPSILKNRVEGLASSPRNSLQSIKTRVPKKSILKYDSMDEPASTQRGVLKKDMSLDAAWERVVAANKQEQPNSQAGQGGDEDDAWADASVGEKKKERRPKSSPPLNRSYSGSSSEDVCRSFTDVVIDPIPGQGRRSAPETPVKRGGGTRTPVIPPSSVKISAHGDLAGKLAKLSTQADNIKQRMSFDDKKDLEVESSKSKSINPPVQKSITAPNTSTSSQPAPPSTLALTTTSPATANLPPTTSSPSTHLPPPTPSPSTQLPPPTPSSAAGKSNGGGSRPSRKSELPRAEDFYAIYQQHKRRNSLSPAPSSSPGGASPDTPPSPRVRLRQRSASPQCRAGVQFLEEKAAEIRRGVSQEREMSARTEIQIQGGGIMDRLASLQKHGNEDWRQRAKKHKESSDIIINRSASESDKKEKTSPPVQMRRPQGAATPAGLRPVSLMDRLSKLNQAQNQWQNKVEDKDTKKFTVEGKMEREQLVRSIMSSEKHVASTTPAKPTQTGVSTPLGSVNRLKPDKERRTPQMKIFQGSNTPVRTRPVSLFVSSDVANKTGSSSVRRSNSMRKLESTQSSSTPSSRLSPVETSPIQVNIIPEIMEESLDCNLDEVSNYKPALLTRKTVAPPRRTRGSRNPVKRLMDRQDLVVREEELRHTEDKENKMKSDRSGAHSHLAAEALAGLASTEDFTTVQLRKDSKITPNQNMQPFREKMLIQVKGRRFCQCRLVEPVAASVNSGDSYILITPTELFNWQGKFSNVIERSRSAEVASTILQKKDLGCKKVSRVQTIEEEKMVNCSRENRRFWAALDPRAENPEPRPAGPPQEDEEYEQAMVEASCVYEVALATDELIPIEENWGLPPKYSLLDPAKVLVFDFGSEVYCYSGKNASFDGRKVGTRLAQELWTAGWDYTGCDVNPVYGVNRNMKESARPDWTVLGRINSNMETILFREKFTDWPDKSRVIGKMANGNEKENAVTDVNTPPSWAWADLAGWSGAAVRGLERRDPDLELEGSHLGRGREFYDVEERRQYVVETLDVKAWHVEENTSKPLPDTFSGQFHCEDTYVIRWKYKVALTGRNLKGGASKYSAVGRERCAYFFWQGEQSKISLQGASALQTVELDYEKGPQLRVAEGDEHAAFLSLFNGQMIIYRGRRGSTNLKEARLFLVRGQDAQETYLKELKADPANLRPSGVFILAKRGKLILWIGSEAPAHVTKMAESAASRMSARLPAELGLGDTASVSTIRQGAESAEFLSALGTSRDKLVNLLGCDIALSCTPRLFHMTSVLGSFEVTEILPDQMKLGITNTLLFNQKTLYDAEQPGLFMFDCGSVIWLWQGWLEPDEVRPNEATVSGANTGSGLVRWHAERRAAMSSLLDYAREVRREEGRAQPDLRLVWAGHEPREFTNLFPTWELNEDVAVYNKDMLETPSVESVYARLSRSEYSWEELQDRPFPPGVDPARIEQYLSTDTFQEKFKMGKEDFSSLPRWKQIELKKEVGLF